MLGSSRLFQVVASDDATFKLSVGSYMRAPVTQVTRKDPNAPWCSKHQIGNADTGKSPPLTP